MKYYFDTSVILPALIQQHPKHDVCLSEITIIKEKGNQVLTSTNHTFAELYANITRLPGGISVSPKTAADLINNYLAQFFTPIHLTDKDYAAAINRCAQLDLVSGVIYDALHLQAAIKAEVDVLYTANMRDFRRLYTKDLRFLLLPL